MLPVIKHYTGNVSGKKTEVTNKISILFNVSGWCTDKMFVS